MAEIVDGEAEPESIARLNGAPALSLNIFKVQGSNVVAVGDGVRDAVEELTKRLPPDVEFTIVQSSAETVKACLLYTSDAADERSSVDLGGRRIIKKQKRWKYHCVADEVENRKDRATE